MKMIVMTAMDPGMCIIHVVLAAERGINITIQLKLGQKSAIIAMEQVKCVASDVEEMDITYVNIVKEMALLDALYAMDMV